MDDTSNSPVPGGTRDLRHHWRWLTVFGVLLWVFGIAAIISSVNATLIVVPLFGLLLFSSGAIQLAHGLRNRQWGGFMMPLALGALYMVTGLVLMFRPAVGAISLTLVMAVFFVSTGIFRIAVSLASADFPSSGWVLLNGVVNVLLGMLILRQWPASGLWTIGLFAGIEMLFAGSSLVALALAVRKFTDAGGETIRLAA